MRPPFFSKRNPILQASLLVALSAVLYGFLGFLGTTLLRDNISIGEMQFWRFFIASLWMAMYVIKTRGSQISIRTDRRFLLSMFLLAAIAYAGSSGLFFLTCQAIGTGAAMVIFFSYPVVIALGSWLIHGARPSPKTFFIMTVMILGLYFLKYASEGSLTLYGIVSGILSAIFYALYVMGSKQFSAHNAESGIMAMAVCLGCTFIFLVVTLQMPPFVWPTTLKNWTTILCLGILATAIPIQLMLVGLKHISSMRASLISVLEPVMTVIIGMLLLGENLSNLQLLGVCLILGSALLIQFQQEL